VRRNEAWFIGLACAVGGIAGLCVAVLYNCANLLHSWLFGAAHLSSLDAFSAKVDALVPMAGGLIIGLSGIYVRRWVPRRPVDPIEANALHGGRMSVRDSALIGAQTVISNGFGASVGLEAAYTQMGSGLASWLGAAFKLRRSDMRTLVACGSAGAISAAFGAPLTGAFYAFELILGTYNPFVLAPVGGAAVFGVLVSKGLGATSEFMSQIALTPAPSRSDMGILLLLGVFCALFGILLMRAVSFAEGALARMRLPRPLQPVLGGLAVGLLALETPKVLASGHGALAQLFAPGAATPDVIVLTLLLKAAASVISLGTGFRGGLFFASLFLGGMAGQTYYYAIGHLDPILAPDLLVCTIIGMASLAVAVIGTPLTMTFLALETTGNFPLAAIMLAAASIVSIIVRRTFGYSFATWRLHLRGESIRSAQDVGWMRDLTVGRLMRSDVPLAPADITIGEFIEEFPARSTSQWVALTDRYGCYAGIVFVPDVHLAGVHEDAGASGLSQLTRAHNVFLLPNMNIKSAAQIFEQTETEALAVLNSAKERHVIGLLTEAHVLRRYTDELDKAHRDLAGESWIARV
jgi:CIC family chloride channel protein